MTEPTEPEPIERPEGRMSGREITRQGVDSGLRRFYGSRPGPPGALQNPHSTASWTPRFLVPVGFAVLLVLVQISYPLSSGVARDRVTVVVVLLSAGTALVHAVATRGFRYAVGFLVIVSGLGLLAEIIGTARGFPFGCYDYADGRLGPAVAGVPLVVALAWTGGLYPVWVVAQLLTRCTAGRIVLTAVGAVGWDLFLDPQMVADGQWSWCAAGWGLPGLDEIPYTNYLGWFAVALVMAVLLTGLDRAVRTPAVGTREASAFGGPTADRQVPIVQTRVPTAGSPTPTAGTSQPEGGTDARELKTSAPESGSAAPESGTPTRGSGTAAPESRTESGTPAPELIGPVSEAESQGRGSLIPAGALVPVGVFLWTWLGSTLAHAVFLDLPYSAWYGCVGLGVLGVPLLVRLVRARETEKARTPFVRYFGRRAFRPSRGNPGRRPGTM